MAAVVVNWIFIPNSALAPMQIVGMVVLLFAVFKLGEVNLEKPTALETAYATK